MERNVDRLVFATGNKNKVREVRELLADRYEVVSLHELGMETDLPETAGTIQGNAVQKARYLYDRYGVDCFSEDTGLEIDALGGEPGVNSARYAGAGKDPSANLALVLQRLQGIQDRRARFRTVVALLRQGRLHTFEGVVEGRITTTPFGQGGFGYDPIFIPDGSDRTFAEMQGSEKNEISHRGIAIRRLVGFLSL
ncbi:MAG: RdgB/HAM1 family non-canonical purine pyrophosphatase [Bacteroidota bacterium]